MKGLTFLFVATLALASLWGLETRGFEISAYWDPASVVQLSTQWGLGDCPGDTDMLSWIASINRLNNCEVLTQYKEMGITNLCIHYRAADYDEFLEACGESLAVMNERWPNRMYQYLES